MSSRDEFSVELGCACGRTGTALLSESDGASYSFGKDKDRRTRVETLPTGFHAVNLAIDDGTVGTVDIYCSVCNRSAIRGVT